MPRATTAALPSSATRQRAHASIHTFTGPHAMNIYTPDRPLPPADSIYEESDGSTDSDITLRLPPVYDLKKLLQDLDALRHIHGQAQPGPYHNGEWTGVSLHAQGGSQTAMPVVPGMESYAWTEASAHTPYFRQILEALDCPKQVVRVLTLPPGGVIGEHFDLNTNFQSGLLRLHIPLVTDPDVVFVIDGVRCRWDAGALYYGDFSRLHHVENHSQITRVHLVIDVLITDSLLELFPTSFVQRRRAEGISCDRPAIALDEVSARRYVGDFIAPAELIPLLTLGKQGLIKRMKNTEASIEWRHGGLVVALNGEAAFGLEAVGNHTFNIRGMPPGFSLEIIYQGDGTAEACFTVRGLPKDLFSGVLGHRTGPNLAERTFRLPLALRV